MNSMGKIALIIPEFTDTLEYDFIRGVHSKCSHFGYDLILLTGIFSTEINYPQKNYLEGQKNIFQLALQADFDGILFAAARFKNRKLHDELYHMLEEITVPCLVMEEKNTQFPYVIAPQRKSIKKMTRHLLVHHHCKNLYCLTGPKGYYESEERLAGFCDALKQAGIPVEQDHIFYGDFWREIPYQLGRDIASGAIPKPDGIVCTSDVMAIALCDALTEYGIRVPRDIAITGYDGSLFSSMHNPTITTVSGRDYYTGQLAMCQLYQMISHNACQFPRDPQVIRYGSSCGCSYENMPLNHTENPLFKHFQSLMWQKLQREPHLASNFIAILSNINTFPQFVSTVDKLTHLLHHWQWLDLCLCEDWKFSFDNPSEYRKKGFSDKMFLTISKNEEENAINQYPFSIHSLLPRLEQPHSPELIICTSLHSENQIFGYLATAYHDIKDFTIDEHYLNWCDAVSNGLKSLENNLYNNYMKQQIPASYHSSNDFQKQFLKLRHELLLSPQYPWNIPELAEKVGVSVSHFQRLYKTYFSIACMNDIINMRLEKAKHLLTYTNLRVHEIAEQCGYQNTNHFIRQFKSRYGISALQYRKNSHFQ